MAAEADAALPVVDLAIVVADPDPGKAGLIQPTLRHLESLGIPRAIFVGRMDQARGAVGELLAALARVSATPVVARQVPLFEGEKATGYVDLALERAYAWRPGEAARQVELTGELATMERDARFQMLERLADFDDALMEQLLSDEDPARDLVFADLSRDLADGLITPVFFGSATSGFGVRRLLKALRHEAPDPARAAERLGLKGAGAAVVKVAWAGQAGKLAYARVFGAPLADGADVVSSGGEHMRIGGLTTAHGAGGRKVGKAEIGEIVAMGKLENVRAGDLLGAEGKAPAARPIPARPPLFALAIGAASRKDDVRLSGALERLLEEDPGLALTHDAENRLTLLAGQGEGHLRLALERLKRRSNIEVTSERPATSYRETIRQGARQRGRHKKQTGGHGQFADVTIEIAPRPRGDGFAFVSKITGGVVPRQWIPAVEQGVRDGLAKGPLGFPVVDVEVTLLDGAFHTVDSSEMAFRTAGKIAIDEGLKACGSRLLEPIDKVRIFAPSSAIAGINAALSARRGQILGFGPREGWAGWEAIEGYLPAAERHDLIAEIRSLTQGLGTFEFGFDHLAELTGRAADDVTAAAKA
ncbi:MAG: elongation factor G [Caulobacteraceae bacterium]|nr:elongation factor G [Caulobacteraceae bacterium]